jgi:uncharacterized protein YkwD
VKKGVVVVSLSSRTHRAGLVSAAVAAFVLVPAASAVACSGASAPREAQSTRQYVRAVHCLLNGERARAGLAPLAYDRRLARAARRFSQAMARSGFFDHVSPQGSTLGDRVRQAGWSGGALGETIAWGAGSQSTPAAIVAGWMASPPHRGIILDGTFREVGLGVAPRAPSGAAGATVTADYGT